MSRRRSAALFAALMVTVAIAALHAIAFQHGGALWRDEVNGVNVATLPSFADIWNHLRFESFPLLWPMVLRGWIAIFGDGDGALRILGTLVGLGLVGSVWVSARLMGVAVPLFGLTLFALHPAVIRYGDSLRAYGLGAALLLLAVAAMWRIYLCPSRRNVIGASTAIFLAAHCVYYNALFLAAAFIAMTFLCILRRRWKPVLIIAAIGAVTAASCLPYLMVLRQMSQFSDLMRLPIFTVYDLLDRLVGTLDQARDGMNWLWLMLAACALLMGAARITRRRPQAEATVFAAITLVLGLSAYGAFLMMARYPAWATYFIVPMALAALCMDVAAAIALRGRSTWAQPVLLVLLTVLGGSAAWQGARTRMTNVDAVAAVLNEDTTANDLVIVMHWSAGVSFDRYYHGAARWVTVPPLADHQVHRFDELKLRMADERALVPIIQGMAQYLKSGGRVYLVRMSQIWPQDRALPALPVAPHPQTGWHATPYAQAWQAQVDYLVWQRAGNAADAPLPDVGPVQESERLWLAVVRGWRVPSVP